MSQGEVFTRYRALNSSSSIPPYESPEVKKINDLDFVDFLFELIKASKGQNNYKNVILKGVFSELKQKSDIDIQIKKILKEFFACEQSILIPDIYTVNSVTGIDIDLSEIDPQGLLKTDPNSDLGKHLYDGNNIEKHINFLIHESLKTTASNPMVYSYKNRDLFEIYATSASSVRFKFGDYYKSRPLSDWIGDYLDSTNFFNLPNFTAMLMDLLTGAVSISAGKGKLEVKQDSALIKALKKIFGFCSENTDNNQTDGSLNTFLNNNQINQSEGGSGVQEEDFFAFTPAELDEIQRDADLRTRGVVQFSTCGDLELNIDPAKVLAGLDSLFGSFQQVPGNTIDQLVPDDYDNLDPIFNIDKTNNFFDDMLKQGAIDAISQGETSISVNFPNMQAEMQLGLFKAIPYALIKSVMSPKLLLIPKISSAVISFSQNSNTATSVDVKSVVSAVTPILRSVGLTIIDKMMANIFNSIKKDILNLTKDLAVKFIKQRGADYILTLTSILRLLKKFLQKDNSRCGSVISKLLSLLNMANFGPMPSVPGPLILIGGALKPGLNVVSMTNDLKAKLQDRGIETAPFFPDGSPNYMMYAMESILGVVTEHIKTNSKIDVYTMGATGPTMGFGQMQ